jgi:hypothetical protein
MYIYTYVYICIYTYVYIYIYRESLKLVTSIDRIGEGRVVARIVTTSVAASMVVVVRLAVSNNRPTLPTPLAAVDLFFPSDGGKITVKGERGGKRHKKNKAEKRTGGGWAWEKKREEATKGHMDR